MPYFQSADAQNVCAHFFTTNGVRERTRAAFFLGAYLILQVQSYDAFPMLVVPCTSAVTYFLPAQHGMTPDEAFQPFSAIHPYPFEDFRNDSHLEPSLEPLSLVRYEPGSPAPS